MDTELKLKDMAGIESFSTRFSRLGDRYIFFRIATGMRATQNGSAAQPELMPALNKPFRLNGMLFLLVHGGSISVKVNTDTVHIKRGELLAVRTGTLMVVSAVDATCDFSVLFISNNFLQSIDIDLHSVEIKPMFERPMPYLRITQKEAEIFRKYLDLLDFNASHTSGSVFATLVARNLMASMVYEMLRYSLSQVETPGATDDKTQGRAQNYIFRFIHLLHIHYSRHRSLRFYAEQLCISPKYLSMLSKEITGQTASEWINRVVIQEAMNMLRFSDMTIQEVAYALSFPSQSAFGKYFKRIVGKSPSVYVKNHD